MVVGRFLKVTFSSSPVVPFFGHSHWFSPPLSSPREKYSSFRVVLGPEAPLTQPLLLLP